MKLFDFVISAKGALARADIQLLECLEDLRSVARESRNDPENVELRKELELRRETFFLALEVRDSTADQLERDAARFDPS